MPFALVTIGLILIVSGSRDTYAALGKELVSDFTGPGNFTYWLVAMGAVGSLGYIASLRNLSRGFLALILISMIIKNGGVFDQFSAALNMGPVRPGDTAKDVNVRPSAAPEVERALPFGFTEGDAKGNAVKLSEYALKFFGVGV